MPKNPQVEQMMRAAQKQLKALREEKERLFPANPHPLAQADEFPKNATPEQIAQRNALNAQIEALEHRIEELQFRLYQK